MRLPDARVTLMRLPDARVTLMRLPVAQFVAVAVEAVRARVAGVKVIGRC